jgi:hypothetical protein
MIRFTTTIMKFSSKGEKTGWTYIEVPSTIAKKLKPGNKKAFRVKGKLDDYAFEGISLLPMGEGNFIMALNAAIRKAIKKQKDAEVKVQMEIDIKEKKLSPEFLECLEDDSKALKFFSTLAKSHQKYFSNWIDSAKTDTTKVRRIAQSVNALSMGLGFAEMIRANKKSLLF